jgi:integrase
VSVIGESPFRLSVMPKVPEVAPRSLTDEELAKVLAATPAEYETAVLLAVLTGLRWGELRRLQWRHLNPGDTPYLVLDRTKSGKVRRVPLVPEAAQLLERARDCARTSFVLPKRPTRTVDFVAPMREVVGFYWTFHQLRHTFACRWLDAGGSKEALQKILGHSTITMTERYGRLSDDAVFAEARGRSLQRPANGGTVVGTVSGTVASVTEIKTS